MASLWFLLSLNFWGQQKNKRHLPQTHFTFKMSLKEERSTDLETDAI